MRRTHDPRHEHPPRGAEGRPLPIAIYSTFWCSKAFRLGNDVTGNRGYTANQEYVVHHLQPHTSKWFVYIPDTFFERRWSVTDSPIPPMDFSPLSLRDPFNFRNSLLPAVFARNFDGELVSCSFHRGIVLQPDSGFYREFVESGDFCQFGHSVVIGRIERCWRIKGIEILKFVIGF